MISSPDFTIIFYRQIPTMTRRFAMILSATTALSILLLPHQASAFSSTSTAHPRWHFRPSLVVRLATSNESQHHENVDRISISTTTTSSQSRRSLLQKGLVAASAAATNLIIDASQYSKNGNYAANAAVGTLPEFADTNAIFQGLTIDVTDSNQYEETIEFFTKGFEGMKVLRERGGDGGGVVKDAVRSSVLLFVICVIFCSLFHMDFVEFTEMIQICLSFSLTCFDAMFSHLQKRVVFTRMRLFFVRIYKLFLN